MKNSSFIDKSLFYRGMDGKEYREQHSDMRDANRHYLEVHFTLPNRFTLDIQRKFTLDSKNNLKIVNTPNFN